MFAKFRWTLNSFSRVLLGNSCWCYFRQLFLSWAFEKCTKDCTIIKINHRFSSTVYIFYVHNCSQHFGNHTGGKYTSCQSLTKITASPVKGTTRHPVRLISESSRGVLPGSPAGESFRGITPGSPAGEFIAFVWNR